MPMTLNDVPTASQTLAETQPLIRGNFNTIDTAFKIDHIEYNLSNTGDQGKHNQVTFPLHVGAISFAVNEIGLFNQNAAPTSIPDIWLKRGAAAAYPMTGRLSANDGWSFWPSGIFVQWGQSSCTTSGTTTFFPTSFAAAPYSVIISQRYGSAGDNTSHQVVISDTPTATTATGFSAKSTGANASFYWFAIGVAP
jgi:hypothetical protein